MAMYLRAFRLGTHQSKAYTGSAGTIDNAVGAGCFAVRVIATSACFIAIGKSPTATTSDIYVPADKPEIFICFPGEKVSAVQSTVGGTLHVTELS